MHSQSGMPGDVTPNRSFMHSQSGIPGDVTPIRSLRTQTTSLGDLSVIRPSEKKLAEIWMANFKKRSISHKRMFLHYARLDNVLRFITVAGTGTAAVITENLNFVEAVGGSDNARLIAMSSTVVAAFALAVNSRLRCKERCNTHTTAHQMWRKLDEDIQKYLKFPPRLPQQRHLKMTDVRKLYQEALKSSPTVPQWINTICCCARKPKPPPALEAGIQESLACWNLDDTLIEETFEGPQGCFEDADVDRLLERYSQAMYIHDETDKLSERYYALSSTIGSCAGAMSVIALSFQAMSLSGEAPAWCHVIGSISSVGLFALSITEGANGFEETWKLLKDCRTEFVEIAHELQQALYS